MEQAVAPPILEWTREIAETIGPAPRRSGGFYWSRFKTPRPPWCVANDPLLLVRKEKHRLLSTGLVTLAYIVRHDAVLDSRGPVHGAADVLYASGPQAVAPPEHLADVSQRLFELRDKADPDPAEQRFVAFLDGTNQRGFGVKTPESVHERAEPGAATTALSSLILYRHFLPGSVLTRKLIPLLVAPQAPRVALPVPKSYWPDAMYDWWLAE